MASVESDIFEIIAEKAAVASAVAARSEVAAAGEPAPCQAEQVAVIEAHLPGQWRLSPQERRPNRRQR